jgi:hypothetical protein
MHSQEGRGPSLADLHHAQTSSQFVEKRLKKIMAQAFWLVETLKLP